jgi:hypothetical protein
MKRTAAVSPFLLLVCVSAAIAAPAIRGRVRGPDGKPLAGVTVTAEAQRTVSDAGGRYALEIDAGWPSEVVFAKPRYGTKRIAVAPVQASRTMPDVALARAAKLVVRVGRGKDPDRIDEPIDVQLGIRRPDAATNWIETRRLAPEDSEATFDDLDTGTYALLLAGPQPLERRMVPLGLAADQHRTMTLALKPTLVRGKLTVRGAPAAGATVMFVQPGAWWHSTATADAAGVVESRTWDRGEYEFYVTRAADRSPFPVSVSLRDQPLTTFSIDIPDRVLRGRVVDEGQPVAGANVVVQSTLIGDVEPPRRRTFSAADGTFAFDGMSDGPFELRIQATGHLRPDPLRLTIAADDPLHDADVVLPRGRRIDVLALGDHQAPLADASIVCAEANRVRAVARTDANGRAALVTPAGGASTIYVFPANGSLAVRHLERDSAEAIIRIAVPPPAAALEINTLTTLGAPVPEVALLMRYNGEVVPPAVAEELLKRQGNHLETDADGTTRLANIPTGTYEFWPYRTAEEVEAILVSSIAADAPITVNVLTGENKATVRFHTRQ